MKKPNPPITPEEVREWRTGSLGTDFSSETLADILNGEYPLEQALEDILSFRPKPSQEKGKDNE